MSLLNHHLVKVVALSVLLYACAADQPRRSESGILPPFASGQTGNFGAAYARSNPYDQLGRESLALGNPDLAASQFSEAVTVNPFDPIALNNLAVAESEQGDYHTAVDLLTRASRLAPENAEVSANLARLRSWLNAEALANSNVDESLGGPGLNYSGAALPPPPPRLWNSQSY